MTAAQRGFNAPELMSKILEQFVGEQREAKPGIPWASRIWDPSKDAAWLTNTGSCTLCDSSRDI